MVQLAGGLRVIAVAVLADKADFPSCHVHSVSIQAQYGYYSSRGLHESNAFILHLSTVVLLHTPLCLCSKTPPLTQLKACIPLRFNVLPT